MEALRQCGAFVQSLASVGKGCPDLLVAYRGDWFVMEIKNPEMVPSRQRMTRDELKWEALASSRAPVHIVRTPEEAIRIIQTR